MHSCVGTVVAKRPKRADNCRLLHVLRASLLLAGCGGSVTTGAMPC
jgi:hypothetical protein